MKSFAEAFESGIPDALWDKIYYALDKVVTDSQADALGGGADYSGFQIFATPKDGSTHLRSTDDYAYSEDTDQYLFVYCAFQEDDFEVKEFEMMDPNAPSEYGVEGMNPDEALQDEIDVALAESPNELTSGNTIPPDAFSFQELKRDFYDGGFGVAWALFKVNIY